MERVTEAAQRILRPSENEYAERMKAVREARARWEQSPALAKTRKTEFKTWSGYPIQPIYTAQDSQAVDPLHDVGLPGEYPYTRGVHETMYRSRAWTSRIFSGFATPKDTNERYHMLLKNGQDGLSVAFDMPTLMGLD